MRGAKLLAMTGGMLLAAILTALPAAAQQRGVPVDQVHAGSGLVALTEVPIRDSAPSGGALYIKGRQIGTLRSGEIITASKEQMVSTLLGNQKWIYISRSERQSTSSGWVLVGNTGTTSGNFAAQH